MTITKQKQTKTNKNKQKQTKTNKNKQKQTKTNKNKQKQTKTYTSYKSYNTFSLMKTLLQTLTSRTGACSVGPIQNVISNNAKRATKNSHGFFIALFGSFMF